MPVLQFGLAAVPHLIEHFDDPRLTRGMFPVGSLASGLVSGLAGGDLRLDPRWSEPAGWKDSARAWWARTKNTREESYVLARVMKSEDGEGLPPNRYILAVLEKKIPPTLARAVSRSAGETP